MNSNLISEVKQLEADVVVIGGGGTGLAAALAAAEKGGSVILVEKQNSPGGRSVCANGFFAAESPAQKRLSIGVMRDDVFKIGMDYSHWTINPRIFKAFIDKSGDTIQWFENKGLQFSRVGNRFPGFEVRGFHGLEAGKKGGPVIVNTLRECCKALGVRLFLSCPAKNILIGEKGEVTGVQVSIDGEEVKIKAKSVIIATGGYSGNKELLKKYVPDYSDNMVFLGPAYTGDGLRMAIETGAATEGLGVLLKHPHIYRGSGKIDALAQEPSTIWVNKKGERFASETITFSASECGNVGNRQLDKCIYVLLDQKLMNTIEEEGFLRGGIHDVPQVCGVRVIDLKNDLQSEIARGEVKISDSWEDIAEWMGITPSFLKSTIYQYNHYCEQGYDEDFLKERRYLKAFKTPPYYGIRCYACALDTIGGIKINHHMEVLNKRDDPIPGLYAGGDAVGGWESDTYCILLPGSALGFALNSGRIAGENAAEFVEIKKDESNLYEYRCRK